MSTHTHQTPAGRVMSEAIRRAINGRSPYPDDAAFIDAGTPTTNRAIQHAEADNCAIVLVDPDGGTRILDAGDKPR
jgi:sirohydrochlorin ferrochelatase